MSVPERIEYRLVVLMFRCRHNMVPNTWQETSSGPLTQTADIVSAHRPVSN